MKETASFPNFSGKHAQEAFFSPADFVAYKRRQGTLPSFRIPEGVIFCYQTSLYRHVLERHAVERVEPFAGEFYLLKDADCGVGFSAMFGIGAPAVTTVLEELIALGIERFVSIGTAGALAKTLKIGDVVVCERAVRDEGVSHHYLAPAKYAEASPDLTDQLERVLRKTGLAPLRGTSWTIDAPYRETVAEARHYQQEGVLTVEMEAAALFAVAQYRGVDLAAAFTISDSLADLVWEPRFGAPQTHDGLERLYQAAVDTLLNETVPL
ncbi:MAG: nucleoside phosphorylase [Thermomicrobiales bacterium]